MKHIQAKCTKDDCGGECVNCALAVCEICHGGEGSLPTECPGRQMTEDEHDNIYVGQLDYRDGHWIKGSVSAFMSHAYPDNNPPVLPSDWQGFEPTAQG